MATFAKQINVEITDPGFTDSKYGPADTFQIQARLNDGELVEVNPGVASDGAVTNTVIEASVLDSNFGAAVQGDSIFVVVTAKNAAGSKAAKPVAVEITKGVLNPLDPSAPTVKVSWGDPD
ncbi:hypothetical protein ADL27_32485 [Streptomyces sp. NRRL F-6602]|nr:hypothetical protein ADL27_32485 [Streptomyces sp. NRRL F-6602]